jgi:hypothetical protein
MKDLLDALTAALQGTGSIQPPETGQKWYMCVSDGQGGFKSYEAHDVFHAERMTREWLAAGWPAWVQDAEGQTLTIATKPQGAPN